LLSVVAPLLALMRPLNRQLMYSDERIEHLAVQDPRVPRLRSVPSVGPVTAAAFLAAFDDTQRFRHAHQLEASLGRVPREYSSGETQRRGPIPKAGHSRTRWLLIQAAVSILRRRWPQAEELRTWALRIAARRGKQVFSSAHRIPHGFARRPWARITRSGATTRSTGTSLEQRPDAELALRFEPGNRAWRCRVELKPERAVLRCPAVDFMPAHFHGAAIAIEQDCDDDAFAVAVTVSHWGTGDQWRLAWW
jgi:hypothetical protein